jgi:hypothetical protein
MCKKTHLNFLIGKYLTFNKENLSQKYVKIMTDYRPVLSYPDAYRRFR